MRNPYTLFFLVASVLLVSCKAYKQDIMLQVTDEDYADALQKEMLEAERNYQIQPADYLNIEVYSNSGERIIDPDFELARSLGGGNNQVQLQRPTPNYLVLPDSTVRLPMVGYVRLGGMRLAEADSLLSARYQEFYKDAFVLTRYINKRVIVLGATGGQVIPLENENMNLLEALALSGGIAGKGKAHNVRLIRQPQAPNPNVQLINLSTIEGMQKASLTLEPGDVIYVEPIRRILPETVRDIGPVVGILSNVLTLVIVLVTL